MKIAEVRERSNEELKGLLEQLNADLFKKKMDLALRQLQTPHQIRRLRKDIAQIKTIIRERELKG